MAGNHQDSEYEAALSQVSRNCFTVSVTNIGPVFKTKCECDIQLLLLKDTYIIIPVTLFTSLPVFKQLMLRV